MKKAKYYLLSILIALAVGGLSALLTLPNMNIYGQINQPPLAPPSILFPIVWTLLYILMGWSAATVYTSQEEGKGNALFVYAVSLLLNFSWSIFFFNLRSFIAAFVVLALLWISIVLTIVKYYRIDKRAALLQIPYLLWVTFAGYLNLAIALLN